MFEFLTFGSTFITGVFLVGGAVHLAEGAGWISSSFLRKSIGPKWLNVQTAVGALSVFAAGWFFFF